MVTGRLALLVWLACGLASSAEKSAFGPVVIGLPPAAKTEAVQDQLVQRLKDLLKQTSQVLYKATGIYFGEVIFVVPSSWEISRSWQYDYVGKPPKSDIVVTDSYSVFGSGPHTLQFGPCGSRGLRINIPETFLLPKDTEYSLEKAKQLSREWIKYRYGVFDEHGFVDDIRYPLYSAVLGSEQLEVTDCTDAPVQYMFRDRFDRDCRADVGLKTGLPDSECYPRIDVNGNDNVTSSLMYSHVLRNVEFLCGDGRHPHKNLAPNKQNVLCNGRSIRDVLAENSDFKNKRMEEDTQLAPDLTFHFSKEVQNRIVVALDASAELAKYKDIIRNALANLIYSLPSGSEFGITVATEDGLHTISGNEDLNDQNNLILKTKTVYQGQPCPECSVRRAIEMIKSSTGGKYGSIVLLSSANLGNVGSGLVDEVKSAGACLTVVLFPGATSSSYEDVFGSSLCGSVTVPDDISFSTLRVMYEALERPITTEHSKTIKLKATEISSSSKNEFVVDSAMTRIDVWLTNKSSEMEIAQNNIRIYPVDGAEQQMQRITSVDSFVVLRIVSPLAGLWTCSLDYGSSLFLKITATLKDNEPLQTEAWFLDTTTEGTDIQMPVILYVAVMKGIHPIINASVKAEIRTPNKDSVVFNLRDNGLGDPDITRNDGVYSRYFVNFGTVGEYETTISISNKEGNAMVVKPDPQGTTKPCCGSEVLPGEMERVEPFYREVKLYFTTRGKYPERGYGPSTIQDLQVTAVDNDLFKLRWTAPGGIKDHGKVVKYMLKQHQNYDDFIHDREKKINGFQYNDTEITPKSYDETEEMELFVTDDTTLNATYFLTLITLNDNGVESSRSNVVKVFLDPDLKSKTLEPKSTSPTIDGNGDSVKHGQLSKETIGYIIGAVLALILIICGYIAFYCYMKRRQKKEETEEKPDRKERSANNNNNDGSVTADGWKLSGTNHISPVNSVPASVLLYHHEQVKEARRKNKEPPLFKLEHIKETEEKLSHSSMQSLPNSHNVSEEAPTITTVDIEYTRHDRPSHPSPQFKDSPPKPGLLVTDV